MKSVLPPLVAPFCVVKTEARIVTLPLSLMGIRIFTLRKCICAWKQQYTGLHFISMYDP